VLGIGWKWAHEKQVHWIGQNETSTFAKDKINDFEVIRVAWELLDEADVVIAHNGKQFDIKKLNTRFLLHGLTPPAPYAVLDTKLIARRYFGFTSNKLDELSRQLDKERKLTHTGKKLWFDCMEGDEKAWRLMGKYCKQDVLLLEKKYKSFLPWTEQHPNWNLHG
jgi:DNA polymerase III epsilon subunit-like protein